MLTIRGLRKSYGTVEVLKGVDLNLEAGEVYGLVGKNGAGKTTLMNIVAGQLSANGGEISLGGNEPFSAPGRIAYILDIPAVYGFMTAYEYLAFIASGTEDSPEKVKSRSEELLRLVGLEGVGSRRIKQFSRGMQQRFGIAAGIYADPALILMDEPCSALDPQGRFEVNNIIMQLAAGGKTILLSTHILSDVERVCTKIGLLINGKIGFEGTKEELFRKYSVPVFEIRSEDNEKLAGLLEGGFILDKRKDRESLYVTIDDSGENEKKLFAMLAASGLRIDRYGRRQVTLEEIFVRESAL